jgi:hypothetical protein
MKLDFLIPGSPNDGFLSQIALFRLALDALGGAYREARLVAVFGAETRAPLPAAWKKYYDRIDVEWAAPADFTHHGFTAQGDTRFDLFRADADLVVFCDADTIILQSFMGAASDIVRNPTLAGVTANYHFPWSNSTGDARKDWDIVAKAVLGRHIALDYQYTLQDPASTDRCPFYVNYGFFAGPPRLVSRFRAAYREIRPKVDGILNNYFGGQVALALTVAALELPAMALPIRFNFPNDPRADALYSHELESIVILHYMVTHRFDRQVIFTADLPFRTFLELDLNGSNRVLQTFVSRLTGGRYPFTR